MTILENKVVLVRFNTEYPENSDKRWRLLVGEIESDHELKKDKLQNAEYFLVDHIVGMCAINSWSGIVMTGGFKHHLLLRGEHLDIRQSEDGSLVAYVGTFVKDTEEKKPVNPELELDAE
jgi:hypothetical protein